MTSVLSWITRLFCVIFMGCGVALFTIGLIRKECDHNVPNYDYFDNNTLINLSYSVSTYKVKYVYVYNILFCYKNKTMW